MLSSIILINFEINPITSMIDLWNQADQGGARIALLKNGIEAYSYSPIIGHGGGAFSGTYHAFGRFEAHNTYVDLLTIGGPILMLIFIIPLLAPLLYLHRNKEYLTLAFLVAVLFFLSFILLQGIQLFGRFGVFVYQLSTQINLKLANKNVWHTCGFSNKEIDKIT